MAYFIDCGTIAVESDTLIMRVMAGHRALMFCLRRDVGSRSSSYDLVADAKIMFFTFAGEAASKHTKLAAIFVAASSVGD